MATILTKVAVLLGIALSEMDGKTVKSHPRSEEIIVKFIYFVDHACTADMEFIRRGTTTMIECQEHSMAKGLDLPTFRKIFDVVSN